MSKFSRKGVFMGKLKEKLKPEKTVHISSIHTSLFYVHDDCFCMIMFLRELRYQIGILQRYGLRELEMWCICVIVCSCMCIFLLSWCKDYYLPCSQKGPERIKHPNGLYGMPIECCAAIYSAEVILLCMSISSGEYTYIGMLG